MANISGKVTAITVLTPMRPWKRVILQALFRLVSWGFYSSIQQKLVKLSFIHFANWSVIRRSDFPHLDPDQPIDRPHYDYLLFCSNFNGDWDQYIDAFSQVIPLGMDNIWKWTEKFPGAVPETPFFNHIRHNQYSSDYYYTATPGAACSDIKSALALLAKLREFADRCGTEPPEQFARSYAAFLTTVQGNMGQTGLPEWLQPWQDSAAPPNWPSSPVAGEAPHA
jgi:hypothetical protein